MNRTALAIAAVAFMLTIPLANWMIGAVGTCVGADSSPPCVIPVWPGLQAPSGVLAIGLALVLRDYVHERMGEFWAACLVMAGALLSTILAPASLAVASCVSFLFSELADLAAYEPLRRRGRHALAVLASGGVGAAVDSALFLWLAFGSLDFFAGQIVGKLWASVVAAVVILIWRLAPARAP